MRERLRELLGAFDPGLPLERARTIPASWYTDPELAQLERERVFRNCWLVVGRVDQVQQVGSFFTADVAGIPILAARDSDGTLRAFLNVCRHRAAPLLTEPSGHVTKFRCPYHGWTYDLTGKLRGTPEFDGVEEFRREDNGLVDVQVQIWGPLVAVHLGRPEMSFADFIRPLPDRIEPGVQGLEFVERREYELECNWKVFVDNYLDGGYHVNTVHPALADMIDYSQYRTDVFASTSVQSSPLTTAAGAVRTGRAQYWFAFPNFMLNLYDGVMDTNAVLPLGPNRCRVIFDFYFAKTGPASDAKFRAESIAVADRVQQEDAGICQEVQRGLASGAFDTGRFSVKREAAGYHFHHLLAQRLQA